VGRPVNDEPIHVSMGVNAGFELPLAVALTSLAVAHRPGTCEVTVLHSGLAARARRHIEQGVGHRLRLDWRRVDDGCLVGAHVPPSLTTASLYRLLLPEMLSDRRRTIYLDADVVVLDSLRPLWDLDLDGRMLAAVRDAAAPWAAGPFGTNWRELGLPPETPYFNSGVMILPLDVWRENGLAHAAISVLRSVATRWGDQCAINVVAEGRWLELPRRWNLQTADADGRGLAWALWRRSVEEALADPAVIHFNERSKPWRAGPPHPLADEWFRILDRTDRSGWRPEPGPMLNTVRREASAS